MKTLNIFLIFFLITFIGCTIPKPTDKQVEQEYARNLKQIQNNNKKLVLLFGADWCGDCKVLDMHLTNSTVFTALKNSFLFQKVDVGRFDKNILFNNKFQDPIDGGIPAIVIVDKAEKILVSTNSGYFSNARKMSASEVLKFFKKYM